MVENFTTTMEQMEYAEPISADPDKLREQISENKVGKYPMNIGSVYVYV